MEKIEFKNRDDKSFLIYSENSVESGLVEVLLNDKFVKAIHTEVKPEESGKGIGKKLFYALIDYARKNNLKVRSSCPYICTQLSRHSEEVKDVWEDNQGC